MTPVDGVPEYGRMGVAFLESIKYVGHLFPVAFFRIYVGYYFFHGALERLETGYLREAHLAGAVQEWIPHTTAAEWYIDLIQSVIVPYWQAFSYLLTGCEFFIGISFIVGFLVRPAALIGIFLYLNFVYADVQSLGDLTEVYLAVFVMMFWLGAGRCLGFDYFFFKRQRGIWW
ncbi:MAG: DoxX family membrane protein [Pseudobdellovibrionaceae bacterium]|nr:DoxX family membrane protein [Bdellovibrionales bacterium]USN46530.1 MAG: DoxX family membrane protein [Pseudobdellovibrionaceae bacterium]